jgi:FKBP-type peptidyl-prolyl cis-trans isomerase 2
MIDTGKKVKFAYTIKMGSDDIPSQVQEVEYEHGKTNIIPQLEQGLTGLSVGDKKKIMLTAQQGDIPYDQDKVQEISKDTFQGGQDLAVGKVVQLNDQNTGQVSTGTIKEIKENDLVVDFNHPLAGKDVEFDVEVLSVEG